MIKKVFKFSIICTSLLMILCVCFTFYINNINAINKRNNVVYDNGIIE